MDINLHIGAHRNATTTLQQFLKRNQSTLRSAGVEVWTPERTRNGLFSGLIERPEDITEQIERRGQRSCGVIAIELELAARAGRNQVLIAEENMIGSTRNNLRQGRLYPLPDERLRRFLPAFGWGIRRIGLSIRSYDTFWASSLSYGIAQGFRVPTADDLDRYVTQPRRWRHVIADISAVFPNADIIVWPFERFAGQPEAQLAFLTGDIGQHLPLTGARDWINPSPRCDKLRTILALRGESAALDMTEKSGRWMPFDDTQRMALRAQYSVDLDWLRAGADGLARFVDNALPLVTHATPGLRLRYDMDGTDGANRGRLVPYALSEGGREYGTQKVLV